MLHIGRGKIDPTFVAGAKAILAQTPQVEKFSVAGVLAGADPEDQSLQVVFAKGLVNFFWNKSPFPNYFQALFGKDPLLLLDFLTIRHHESGTRSTHVEWHLDANFHGYVVPMLTGWVPLDPVGVDAPGLEFLHIENVDALDIIRRWQALRASLEHGASVSVGDESLSEMLDQYQTRTMVPTLGPGDCLIFDQLQFHRTQPIAGTKSRTAIEFRFASRDKRPLEWNAEDFAKLMVSTRENGEIRIGRVAELLPDLQKA